MPWSQPYLPSHITTSSKVPSLIPGLGFAALWQVPGKPELERPRPRVVPACRAVDEGADGRRRTRQRHARMNGRGEGRAAAKIAVAVAARFSWHAGFGGWGGWGGWGGRPSRVAVAVAPHANQRAGRSTRNVAAARTRGGEVGRRTTRGSRVDGGIERHMQARVDWPPLNSERPSLVHDAFLEYLPPPPMMTQLVTTRVCTHSAHGPTRRKAQKDGDKDADGGGKGADGC